MKNAIRVAQLKIVPAKGDLRANHERLMAVLGQVEGEAVDVVITPEGFLDGYIATEEGVTRENIHQYAVDPADSPLVAGVSQWARSHSAWFVLGCTRRVPEGVYNTALIFDRQGGLKGIYDKTHCQLHDKKYLAGQRLEVFKADFGPFGVMICADRRWPETVRSLALQGARVIFNPTYGMYGEQNLWLMRTRSYESEVFIAFTHPLEALITDPNGEVVTDETSEQTLLSVTEIDLAAVDQRRARDSSHLKDRRTELYTL
ncbi:MAG: carbon-nitrogen hydrolase family protein [Candidatus Latescibacteria bacterium]|nr:carbon-nitrogen hydrolase family protein [Candidatus Latescibacterota bacterium]